MKYSFLLVLFFQTARVAQPEEPKLRLAYIANMGVLAEAGEKTVLFDGLHKFYKPDYLFPTVFEVGELISGRYHDFSAIEAAVFTHEHKDHFDAEYCRNFLSKNKNSIVVGSPDIQKAIDVETNRNRKIDYDGALQVIENQGIKISGFRMDHGGHRQRNMQNIAYVVELTDYKILHIGDSGWEVGADILRKHKIKEMEIDVAILPYWLLMSKTDVGRVSELISPKKIIATHIPPNLSKSDQELILSLSPKASLFMEKGEVVDFLNKK